MNKNLNILSIDTAMNGHGVGVWNGAAEQLFSDVQPMIRGQAETLVPAVQAVIGEAGLSFEGLDLVVATIGPGAFTGLRIGLSAAQSFGLALDIPVMGLTTLEVLNTQYRQAHEDAGDVAVLIETKRDDFYFQRFNPSGVVCDPQAVSAQEVLEQADGCVFVGDAVVRFGQELEQPNLDKFEISLSSPAVMIDMAKERYKAGGELVPVSPLYLRPADVSKPKTPPRRLSQV